MPQALITERYTDEIAGVLDCYDRIVISIVISGQLGSICYAKGMTEVPVCAGIRIFHYPKTVAEPLRDTIREHAIVLAESAGVEKDCTYTASSSVLANTTVTTLPTWAVAPLLLPLNCVNWLLFLLSATHTRFSCSKYKDLID
jgi:hypothetical protein